MLDFSSLKPHREVFIGPDGNKYVLTGATADAAVQYRNANLSAAVLGPDGKVLRWTGMADSEPVLVGCCVYAGENPSPDAAPVGDALIRRWPPEVMKTLYDRIHEVSPNLMGIDKEEKGKPDPKK